MTTGINHFPLWSSLMAKNEDFETVMKRAIGRVRYLTRTKAKNLENEVSLRVCQCFVARARARLLQRATPATAESEAQVLNLAYSITIKMLPDGRGYSVRVPADSEGLNMFLEFGTGLTGEANAHPEASSIGWAYAVNRENYIGGGWIFNPNPLVPFRWTSKGIKTNVMRGLEPEGEETGFAYIDQNDIYPMEQTKKYKSKKTGVTKTYTRKRNRVFTKGLMPTRYLYDTKQDIKNFYRLLASYKSGELTIAKLYEELDKLERSNV